MPLPVLFTHRSNWSVFDAGRTIQKLGRQRRPGRHLGSGKVPRVLTAIVAVMVALLWFNFARPQVLGGPVTYIGVSGTSMLPTLRTGDLVIVTREDTYRIGDVIVYTVPDGEVAAGERVIHRIVGGDETDGFVMKGDNNTEIDRWRPTDASIIGTASHRLPRVASLLGQLRKPWILGLVIGVLTFLIMIGVDSGSEGSDDDEPEDESSDDGMERVDGGLRDGVDDSVSVTESAH